jgi:hypothetical protein
MDGILGWNVVRLGWVFLIVHYYAIRGIAVHDSEYGFQVCLKINGLAIATIIKQ